MMLIQIIWACEQSEFEFMVQRKLKNCHYIGSYCKTKVLGVCIERREAGCCFTSPLSRIIQEQVRPQLGKTWGTAQQPTCEGLRVDEIGKIDWSMVNLDEWLQLLAESGRYPTNATLNADSLTGSGNPLALPGREDATSRATKRLQGLDVTGIRSQAEQEMLDRQPH
jgi:conjugal transfer mating pair stabilization protein TraN